MIEKNIRTIRSVTFLALLSVAAAFIFPISEWTISKIVIEILLVLIAAVVVTWALETWLRFLLSHFGTGKSEIKSPAEKSVSEAVPLILSAAQALLTAHSRKEVIEIVMLSGVTLLAADGASFVGFEEWGSPMQIETNGVAPQMAEGQWPGRLISPATRQSCRSCDVRESGAGCKLFAEAAILPSRVICQPLSDGSHEVGIISFHFNTPVVVSAEQKVNLAHLARNGSITLSALRKRELESIAYRDMQTSSNEIFLKDKLTDLCGGIKEALNINSVVFWVVDGIVEDQGAPIIYFDDDGSDIKDFWTADLLQKFAGLAKETPDYFSQEIETAGVNGKTNYTVVFPAAWRQPKPLGLLILVSEKPLRLNDQQLSLLKVVAREASLLVTTGRAIDHLEFKAVGEERIRLAREIHDGLSQTLAYLKIQSTQMLTFLSSGKLDKLETSLTANYQTLSEAYQDARYTIDNLRSIPDGDTRKWLLEQAANFAEATGIAVDTTKLFIEAEIPLLAQVQLIRIVQEAFGNIRKHAKANKVVLSGTEISDEIIIEISDNGLGFEPDLVRRESKYGLIGMRERMDLIGGDFQIISKLGEGTTVRLAIPTKVPVS
jgi:two-component system nitrate/nitrite sensor histidine kinase NarX